MVDEKRLIELATRVSQLANIEANELAHVMYDASAAILSLLDELKTLRSERTAWRVTAENAEKDAERYRWVRSGTCGDRDSRGRMEFHLPDPHPLGNIMKGSVAQHLDAAIDSAMKGKTP